MKKQEREEFYKRVVQYFNDNESTMRETAEACHTSRQTVHTILTKKMPNATSAAIIEKNKKERSKRGGESKRRKCGGG